MNLDVIKKILRSQLMSIAGLLEEKDPWLYAVYEPAISKMSSILLMDPTEEKLEEFRQILHVCNSSVSTAEAHGGEKFEDEKIFGYLYSIHDFLSEEVEFGSREEDEA